MCDSACGEIIDCALWVSCTFGSGFPCIHSPQGFLCTMATFFARLVPCSNVSDLQSLQCLPVHGDPELVAVQECRIVVGDFSSCCFYLRDVYLGIARLPDDGCEFPL